MATQYAFKTQLKKGQRHEDRLDAHFSEWFQIFTASHEQQRQGIDREYYRETTNAAGNTITERLTIEYKADERARQTHNAFIETVSVQPTGNQPHKQVKPGWAYTSQADYIIYYIPGDELAYILQPARIRAALDRWSRQFRQVNIPNDGYNTVGILVPLAELERIAHQTISL